MQVKLPGVGNMIDIMTGALSAGLLLVAGFIVQIRSRTAVLEADRESLVELIDTRFDDVTRRLSRIESKLDKESK